MFVLTSHQQLRSYGDGATAYPTYWSHPTGIRLRTPGYKASGLSTYSNTMATHYFQEVFLQKFQDKSRVKLFLHTACCSMRMSTICLHGNSLGKHFYKIEQDGGYKGKSHDSIDCRMQSDLGL